MPFGVNSEVGRLRQVMVHRPGLEHTRLTPSNAAELLFDDVLWVARAKQEHDAFAGAMRDRGVEVYEAEELLAEAVVKPDVKDRAGAHILSARHSGVASERDWGGSRVEGGGVRRMGSGGGMIGRGERTPPQAVLGTARSLFRAGAAQLVLAVHLPMSRSYMHLDTVITMCDRDLVTLFPQVVSGARTWAIRPGESAEELVTEEQQGSLPELMAKALGVRKMRIIETGGDAFGAEREQ